MLEIIEGDAVEAFLNSEIDVLIHQANCQNTMRSGIAKQIYEKIPAAAMSDSWTIKGDPAKLGTFSIATIGDKIVFNLYSQFDYGSHAYHGFRHTDYDAMRRGMEGIFTLLMCGGGEIKVGLPLYIGCGLGRGDWTVVRKIIEETLCRSERIRVCAYELV